MNLKLYFPTAPTVLRAGLIIFLGIDAVWLGLVAPRFYCSQIRHLMANRANLPAALIFYLLFIGVQVYFVIAPGLTMPVRESSCAARY